MVSETVLVISMGAYSRPYNFLQFFIYAVLLYNSNVGGCSVGVCDPLVHGVREKHL